MIASDAFRGKSYAVLGLARSGRATVEALLASGAGVMAWDSNEAARIQILPGTGRGTMRSMVEGAANGVSDHLETVAPAQPPLHQPAAGPPPRAGEDRLTIADPLTTPLEGFAGIVVSPGVPINRHPIADRAREANVPLIGDIELFALARPSLPPHKVVGITGTNGKSTTTALIHHILKTAGIPTTMAGNIGLPILSQDPLPEGGVYVLELSSYQIDLTTSLDCDVAVLLNVTPDHLDRYESFEAYRAAKFRLFEMQSSEHAGVIASDDPALREIMLDMFGGPGEWSRFPGLGPHADQANWPSLQGPHNMQNVAAAMAACLKLGVHLDVRHAALRTYPGLPHRMERVAEKHGILFVNDSKATNPTSTAPALAAYPNVHWILGGLPKSDDLDACEPHLGHVRAAYTIGEAGPMFARLISGKVPAVTECEMLHEAVARAAAAAQPGEVVLLSPACASFDQFRDYEARGDAFRAAVEALP